MRRVLMASTGVLVWMGMTVAVQAQTKRAPVAQRPTISFRLASSTPSAGMESASLGRDRTIYVSKHPVLTAADVRSATAAETRQGSDIVMSLSKDALSRLSAAMRKSGAEMLAMYMGKRLVTAGPVQVDQAEGTATVGGIDPTLARNLSAMIVGRGAVPLGPTLTLAASRSTIAPGETVTIDAFVRGAPDVRSFQVTLITNGGERGKLIGEDLWIDKSRNDYLFGTQQALDAVDPTNGRLGGVLFEGGIDTTSQPRYLGSFKLRASNDAAGTFTIGVKEQGRHSFLWTSQNKPISFYTETATITVGAPKRVPTKR